MKRGEFRSAQGIANKHKKVPTELEQVELMVPGPRH